MNRQQTYTRSSFYVRWTRGTLVYKYSSLHNNTKQLDNDLCLKEAVVIEKIVIKT